MSISSRGVKIQKRGGSYWLLIILTFVELVFSFLLVVSLASNLLFPQRASAVAGVSAKLSYQGRLTDLSGNPLGGSGTNYCFRFSIYDAATAGTKVWPSGAPSSTTVKVEDGVFNTDLGTADSLAAFDFASNDLLYLNVEVNATPTTCGGSWEQLDLRQRIDSVGYARAAEGVYSSLLRAPTGGTAVQIGTGAGAATPIFLNLDVKNTQEAVDASCSTNGQLWYNSADSRARVCQGSVIRDMIDGLLVKDEGADQGRASTALDFTGGGVSASKGAGGVININIPFSGVAVNAAGTVSSGVVVFSNSNNVTFGINGSTITASITAAGGAGANANTWSPFIAASAGTGFQTLASASGQSSSGSLVMIPITIPFGLQFNQILVAQSLSYVTSAASNRNTYKSLFGLYSMNANTLSLISSNSFSIVETASGVSRSWNYPTSTATSGWGYGSLCATGCSTTAQIVSFVSGLRVVGLQFGGNMTVTPGMYWLGLMSGRTTSSLSGFGLSHAGLVGQIINQINSVGSVSGLNPIGKATSQWTASASNVTGWYGRHMGNFLSATSVTNYGGTAIPPAVTLSQMQAVAAASTVSILPMVTFVST